MWVHGLKMDDPAVIRQALAEPGCRTADPRSMGDPT